MNGRFFSALALVRVGREAEVIRDLDAVRAAGWVGIAVKLTALGPPRIHPEQANYWTSLDKLLALCAERGLTCDCIIFGDDVKRVMPDSAQRRDFVTRAHGFLQGRPDVDIVLMDMTPQIALSAPPPSIDPFYDEVFVGGYTARVVCVVFLLALVAGLAWWVL